MDCPVARENRNTGTTDWQLTRPAQNREIEGYASAVSVAPGESISLFVSTGEPSYTLEIYRMGWYDGLGGRRMLGPKSFEGHLQTDQTIDPDTGLIECNWQESYRLSVPDWVTGVYLAKITASSSGAQSYIMFVIRDDAGGSDLLFQSSVTTFQAYNHWGGRCLYAIYSPGGRAEKVSFQRPYATGAGAAEFLYGDRNRGTAGWEYCAIRFLEREGYDIAYCTNIDVHSEETLLLSHRVFLSVGHDEYWSQEMRQHVTMARDRGVHLAFLGANTCYWQIRLEPDLQQQAAHRTVTCYKFFPVDYEGTETRDPMAFMPGKGEQITIRWRDAFLASGRVARPEQELVGIMYHYGADFAEDDMVVADDKHWIFAQTRLRRGSRLPGLVGYECDRIHSEPVSGVEVLAESPFSGSTWLRRRLPGRIKRRLSVDTLRTLERCAVRVQLCFANLGGYDVASMPDLCISHMTLRTSASGAMVFATGTIYWSWALDNWATEQASRRCLVQPAVQQMMRNLLSRFLNERGVGR